MRSHRNARRRQDNDVARANSSHLCVLKAQVKADAIRGAGPLKLSRLLLSCAFKIIIPARSAHRIPRKFSQPHTSRTHLNPPMFFTVHTYVSDNCVTYEFNVQYLQVSVRFLKSQTSNHINNPTFQRRNNDRGSWLSLIANRRIIVLCASGIWSYSSLKLSFVANFISFRCLQTDCKSTA